MGGLGLIKQTWEAIPVLLLLLVGGAIAVPSGVRHRASREDLRQLAHNLSQIVLRVVGYAAALAMVQEWIGLGPGFGW
ncbi:MAG TPA: hypothetical protein VFF52_09165 [Isosphaeraceae bacterium]|nr:hypothetical protein [Isosphaeraceae bacterium]